MRIGMAARAALLAAAAASVGAQAADRCWRAPEAAAARVREVQTMLMVAALRCRAAGIDIVADYDGFVTAQGPAIAAANAAIKRHFDDQAGYDRFATTLANGFGDDETTEASCADAAAAARDAAGGGLARIAEASAIPAVLPGGPCDAPAPTLASTAPAEALPPVLALAAPVPEAPAAVALPAEVAAALTVLARFRDADGPRGQGATQVAAIAR